MFMIIITATDDEASSKDTALFVFTIKLPRLSPTTAFELSSFRGNLFSGKFIKPLLNQSFLLCG